MRLAPRQKMYNLCKGVIDRVHAYISGTVIVIPSIRIRPQDLINIYQAPLLTAMTSRRHYINS